MNLRKAWLIRWSGSGSHVDHLVKRYSPQGAVVDVLSIRESFEDTLEHTKDLYKIFTLSLPEKLPFAHYTKGGEHNRDFFSQIPVSTHFQSPQFKDYKKAEESNPGGSIAARKFKEWSEESSRYATVGFNPWLELIEVFNLKEEMGQDGAIVLTWDERRMGQVRKRVFETQRVIY